MSNMARISCIASLLILLSPAYARARQTELLPPALPVPVSPAPPPEETSFEVTGRYTAQRRPRVTVFKFDDTNTEAQQARYGSSVEAMLVTFLKRKSQFVVVERQKLGTLLEEKRRIQTGMIEGDPGDTAARALLEKLDAFILGSVTVLNIQDDVKTQSTQTDIAVGGSDQGTRQEIRGPRIEIDAKLLSRFDGRIIAAAQRRGPVACLRSIVERLGIALEQEFLRPYYGRLLINLDAPENVRVFLTPILLDTALDEEKPPVELGSTVTIGGDADTVNAWMTDLTTYRIENLLSGWYSLRLERPGYEKIEIAPGRWETRKVFEETEVYDRVTGLPLSRTDKEIQRFVVHVDPLSTETFDGNKLGFTFRKKQGSLAPQVKRQYLDTDFSKTPQRVILMGGKELELNETNRPKEYADDPRCDLFDEKPSILSDYGRTYVAAGQTFEIDEFKGGELIIEDYKGESVPAGKYRMILWEPRYYPAEIKVVSVHDQDNKKKTQTPLARETLSLELEVTGTRPASRVFLEGRETRHRVDVSLDFSTKEQPGLPIDVYTASTNISGLDGWRRSVDLLPGPPTPPVYDISSEPNEPKFLTEPQESGEPAVPPLLTLKTRLVLGGRLQVFSKPPDPLAADFFLDKDVLKIFNLLLYGHEERPTEEKGGLLQAVGRGTVRILEEAIVLPGQPVSTGTPPNNPSPVPPAVPVEEKPAVPPPPRLPRDPDELRQLLAQHLELIDLLVLDPKDMAQLRKSPNVAAIVQRYIESGGTLFAFVSEAGDYGEVAGAPLVIESLSKPTDRFELAAGEVAGILPQFDKKKMDVKSKRPLPQLAKLPARTPWRVIAFTQGRKNPRIIESGKQDAGGYVALWLDDPDCFRGRLGGTVPKVEETRAKLEERVLEWARYLMYRRYDKTGEQRRRAEEALGR